jgi:chemotaxis protein MotB
MTKDKRDTGDQGGHGHAMLIVRRRSGRDAEGHHGGVWKIAYADFMTAMMAFFLVMWLVNSTDEKTIVQVAAYFNPLRLSDKVPSDRGLHDAAEAASGVSKSPPEVPSRDESRIAARQRAEQERRLFADPESTLDKLAQSTPPSPDPVAAPSHVPGAPPDAAGQISPPQQATPAQLQELRVLAALIEGAGPRIEVQAHPEGTLISLSDRADFGMFASGSAEPRPPLVHLVARIARVLQALPGPIVVRGHTDGRPFRNATYDNWRLSSARAHMASYMLVHGGLDGSRITRVEGHADRMLRNSAEPGAAENRRIEFLLKVASP